MSRAILVFDLPDEAETFEAALRGTEWREVVDAVAKHLRDQLKYGKHSTKTHDALAKAQETLFDEARARELEVWP